MSLDSDTNHKICFEFARLAVEISIVQYLFYSKHIIIHITTHLNDKDERKVLVEGCEHCRNTGWVIIGVAGMRQIIKNIKINVSVKTRPDQS